MKLLHGVEAYSGDTELLPTKDPDPTVAPPLTIAPVEI
jgi:hypothetical protein